MALHPLPVDLSLADVLTAVKGYKEDLPHALHGGWHAAGFLLGRFDKHTLLAAAGDRPELVQEVEGFCARLEASQAAAADPAQLATVDWRSLLKAALTLLLQLLG